MHKNLKIVINFGAFMGICIGIGASLCGCGASFNPNGYLAQEHNNLLMQGNSVAYADGYIDGCASGKKIAGDSSFNFSKNTTRYNSEQNYHDGWEQGYQFCREERLNWLDQGRKSAKRDYYSQRNSEIKNKEVNRMWDEMRK